MTGLIKFILFAVIGAVILSVVSIAWPRFTNRQRPTPFAEIYGVVKNTQFAVKVGEVLGVSQDGQPQALDLKTVAGDVMGSAVNIIEKRIQTIIMTQAMIQVMKQYDQLPQNDKSQIQQLICKPTP